MSDTSEPALNWADAPGHFKEAHERLKAKLDDTRAKLGEVDTLKRELTFLKAGVDPNDPQFPYFNAGYTGKLDEDSVRADWQKFKGIDPNASSAPDAGTLSEPPVEEGPPPEIADQLTRLQQERTQLGNGAISPGEEPSPDPQQESIRIYRHELAQGRSNLQAQRAAVQHIFDAAVSGDPRVVSATAAEAQEKWKQRYGFE